MIQINLLPEEFRRPDRTPLPLFLTLIVGVIVVGVLVVWYIAVSTTLTNVTQENERLTKEQAKWQKEADEVAKLQKEISTQKRRQDTIIKISQAKIMWSQKLIQLSQIFGEYDEFWITSLNVAQTGSGGTVNLAAQALGTDTSRVADFRDRITGDTNFFYHFGGIRSPVIRVAGGRMNFNITLMLAAK